MTREEAIKVLQFVEELLGTKLKESKSWDCDSVRAVLKSFDVAIEALRQPQIIRCKDCKHRPSGTGANHDLEFPDDVCPCQCEEDYWYSWMPNDNWFCADGERKEE